MTAYTGMVRNVFQNPGELFPWINPHARLPCSKVAGALTWEVFEVELTGTANAIGTDSYTFASFVTPRKLCLGAAFIIDSVGLSADSTNYNTFLVWNGSASYFSRTTARGILIGVPAEIVPAASFTTRVVDAGTTIYVRVTGTGAGRVINYGTRVCVLTYWA